MLEITYSNCKKDITLTEMEFLDGLELYSEVAVMWNELFIPT